MKENNQEPRHPTDPIRPRRPILLTLVLWIFVLWTVLGWLRFFSAISNRALIFEFLPGWVFWYLLGAGLVWGLTGIPIIIGLVWGVAWAYKLIPMAAGLYPLLYWVERLFIWQSTLGRRNWPFMLLLTLIWIGLVVWVLRSGRVKRFFTCKENKDRINGT